MTGYRRGDAATGSRSGSGRACLRWGQSYVSFQFPTLSYQLCLSQRAHLPAVPFSASSLPAALCHAGNVALEGELAEAETAQRELAEIGARPAAALAPVAQADLELRRLLFFGCLRGTGH